MPEIHIVDDDTFLLGLDDFFREGMKQAESAELLACAESIASDLNLSPKNVPTEGYYHETPELTRYFQLMRVIQSEGQYREPEISDQESWQRLQQIARSTIFGLYDENQLRNEGNESLLPRRVDAVGEALLALAPEWQLVEVLEKARELTPAEDFSLVGLACRFGSPHVVAALRETVALYALMVGGSANLEPPEYRWEVSPELERLANRFIQTVSLDVGFEIPAASPANAQQYFHRGISADILGRCIAVGFNDAEKPIKYYHWAIRSLDGKYDVEEFWDTEMWTTERYAADPNRIDAESIDMNRPLCKRDGCQEHSVKFSLLCRKHHDEMLTSGQRSNHEEA